MPYPGVRSTTAGPFARTVGLLYAAAADPALWPRALTRVADAIGATGGLLTRHPDGVPAWMVVGRLDPELTELYCERHARNPYTVRLAAAEPGVPVVGSTLASAAQIRRTAFHAEILRPQAIEDQIAMPYAPWTSGCVGGGSGGVAFMLSARVAERPSEAMRAMRRIAPHVTQALDLAGAVAAASGSGRSVAAAVMAAPGAMLLLDRAGRILAANPMAETILGASDGLDTGRGPGGARRPVASLPAEDRVLSRAIAAAVTAGEDSGGGARLRLSRPSGRAALHVLVTPLPPPPPPWGPGDDGAAAVMTLFDPAGEPAPDPAAMTAAFGLTSAEARVAAEVARGHGLPRAAQVLGIGRETARSHLARVLAKTGTRSQAQLAALVARLPPR